MVEYRATLTLVPKFPPRRTENFPGNYPSSGEAELLDEVEELARVRQIKEDTRELIFTPEKRTFQIGRASSNPNKGLMATRDNAFFLSPVMSRYHAEVQMQEKKKQIRIRDTDSMHGTYVNGKAIWGQEWQPLNTGDALTFGAQVTREGEVFMPKDFTCDVAWEKVETTTPEANNKKSNRRISGYGVSSEDLVISDDDTESVDFDKTSIEYHCYSEEDYSDDSEPDDIDYEKENTGTVVVEQNFPTSSVRTEEPRYGIKNNEPKTTDAAPLGVRLPSVKSLVPDTTPARGKFSIGSLMNDTLEALTSKRRGDGGEGENANAGSEAHAKGDKKDVPCTSPVVPVCSEGHQAQSMASGDSSALLSTVSNNDTTVKSTDSSPVIDSEGESDSDEEPEELDAKGRVPWEPISISSTPPQETEKLSEKPSYTEVPAPVKPNLQSATPSAPQPGCAGSTNEIKHCDLFDVVKAEELRLKGVSTPAATSGNASGYRKVASPAQKDEFFAAVRDNQNTLVNILRERWARAAQQPAPFSQTPSHESPEGLQPAPLPWVHSSFAPTHLASLSQASNTPTTSSNVQSSPNAGQPPTQNARKPHLFEQLLQSDEAKARTEKLEKLKAAIYNRRGKRDLSFNPWTMEEDEPLEGALFGDEDADALDEAAQNLFPMVRPPRVSATDPYFLQRVEKAKSRGFAISNLVDDQPATSYVFKSAPVSRNWVAEKVPKEGLDNHEDSTMTNEVPAVEQSRSTSCFKPRETISHVSPPRGTKRKYDGDMNEDMNEDKILQEPAPVEEKIAEPSVDAPIVNLDVRMGGVSEEKETYEEAAPVMSVVLNEVTSTVVRTEETPRQAEPQQPPPKRARIFTTGFALGAVTGAVGVFAALVASAP